MLTGSGSRVGSCGQHHKQHLGAAAHQACSHQRVSTSPECTSPHPVYSDFVTGIMHFLIVAVSLSEAVYLWRDTHKHVCF